MKNTYKLTDQKISQIAVSLKTLGHPIRIKIVCLLEKNQKLTVNEILEKLQGLDIDQPTLSHHLIKLKKASILKSTKIGLNVFYELKSFHFCDIIHCFEKFNF